MSNKFEFTGDNIDQVQDLLHNYCHNGLQLSQFLDRLTSIINSRQPEIVNEVGLRRISAADRKEAADRRESELARSEHDRKIYAELKQLMTENEKIKKDCDYYIRLSGTYVTQLADSIGEANQLRTELSTLREQNTAYELTMDNFYKEREALQGQISGLLDERKWISVDDRLPEIGEWYLVVEKDRVDIMFYDSPEIWLPLNGTDEGDYSPTHWRPIPPPPKIKKEWV